MYEFMILIPVCAADDKGNPIPTQATPFDDICARFCEVVGGCTLGPIYEGMWMHEGNLIKEHVRQLYFATGSPQTPHSETLATVRDLARAVKILLNQQCVYLRLPSGDVEFI